MKAFEEVKNPYENLYYWVSGEIVDVNAYLQALEGRDSLLQTKQKLLQKQVELTGDTAKFEEGKIGLKNNLKTLFKNQTQKEEFKEGVKSQKKEVELQLTALEQVVNLVTWHLTDQMAEGFRKKKMEGFQQIMKELAKVEMENNMLESQAWGQVATN